MMFSGPVMFVCTASYGKYSHVGTCFSAAAFTTTSAVRSTRCHRVVVADVADHERQQLVEVAIDDFVGRDDAVLVVQPHVVLLRFVAREHRDAARPAHLAA